MALPDRVAAHRQMSRPLAALHPALQLPRLPICQLRKPSRTIVTAMSGPITSVNMQSFQGVTAAEVFRLAADWLKAPGQKHIVVSGVDYSELHRSPEGSELLSIFFVVEHEVGADFMEAEQVDKGS